MKRNFLSVGSLLLMLTVLCFSPSSVIQAKSYTLSWNLVRGKDLHWRNHSKYTTQLNQAISTWNGQKTGTIKTYTQANTDVTVSDYTENSNTAGVTSALRTIKLNKKIMDGLTSTKKRNVTTHEFGHALGLAHSASGNVLYAYVSNTVNLGTHDKDSFNTMKNKWK